MHRLLRTERLVVDPDSSTASKEWNHWFRTFQNFILTTQADDADKLRLLINHLSADIYDYVSECGTYNDAIGVFRNLFAKPVNEVFARHKLATRKQHSGESISRYLESLRLLSKECNFKAVTAETNRDDCIRDSFIAGLVDPQIRQRLLENPNLTLNDAFAQARALELAQQQAREYQLSPPPQPVNAASSSEKQERRSVSSGNTDDDEEVAAAAAASPKCYFCGRGRHQRTSCPARNAVCFLGEKRSLLPVKKVNDSKAQALMTPAAPLVLLARLWPDGCPFHSGEALGWRYLWPTPLFALVLKIREVKNDAEERTSQDPEIKHSRLSLFFACVRKYCDTTTLHGFKYLSEPKRPLYERIYWLIAILMVYCIVIYEIMELINRILGNPVLITFDSKSRSVEEIPFPAVTICTDNQIRPSIINLTEAIENITRLSPDMRRKLEFAAYICRLNTSVGGTDAFDSQFVHDMLDTTYGISTCKQQLLELEWSSSPLEPPCKYVQPMVTIQGGCLTFNMLPLTHIFTNATAMFSDRARTFWANTLIPWSPDTGFRKGGGSYPGPPPWRTVGNNLGNTANFDLNLLSNDFEEVCSRGGKGFFIYIHNPAEVPSASHVTVYVEDNRDTIISVAPKLYITDKSLDSWYTHERGCYFQTERSLKYFRIYTQHNCEIECESNFTLKSCGCVPFYYPRDNKIPICGPGKLLCVGDSLAMIGGSSGSLSECDCLPSCSELQFEATVTKARRYWSRDLFHLSNESYTLLRVKFQSKFFIGIKRTVMFGFTDFVANIGGLLGLFLGFSILSLVELVYFVCCRPCTNLARRKHLMKINQNVSQNVFSINYASRGSLGYPNLNVKKIQHQ